MNPPAKNFVAYYRVPAQPHAKFGLGLEPQRIATMVFLESRRGALAGEFVEVEAAGQNQWRGLADALAACREAGATLFIPSLGHLAHDHGFLNALVESGVEIDVGDLPRTNLLNLHHEIEVARGAAERLLEKSRAVLAGAGTENGVRDDAPTLRQRTMEVSTKLEARSSLADKS